VTIDLHYMTDRHERFDLKISKLKLLRKQRHLHLFKISNFKVNYTYKSKNVKNVLPYNIISFYDSFWFISTRAKLEKMPSIPEEPEVPENEVERFTMPDFVKPLYDLDVVEGREAVLRCKVAGLPYPTIIWFHNGKRIDSTEDRKMTQCKLVDTIIQFSHNLLSLSRKQSLWK